MPIKKLQWEQSSPSSWKLSGELSLHIYATIVEHPATDYDNPRIGTQFTLVFRTPGQTGFSSGVYKTLKLAQKEAQLLFEKYVNGFIDDAEQTTI